MNTVIIVGLLGILLCGCGKQSSQSQENNLVDSKIVLDKNTKWPNRSTLNIVFLDGSEEQKSEVEDFAVEWTRYANINFKFFDSFKEIPRGQSSQIRITFKGSESSSSVGKTSDNSVASTMRLGLFSNHLHIRRHYILHEFGHALGLLHEHQNANRDWQFNRKVALRQCIIEELKSECHPYLDKQLNNPNYGARTAEQIECKELVDDEIASCEVNYFSSYQNDHRYYVTDYDMSSVMHYSLHGQFFGKSNLRLKTINGLSLNDKIEIANIYPGRIDEQQIRREHQEEIDRYSKVETFGKCRLVKRGYSKYYTHPNATEEVQVDSFVIYSRDGFKQVSQSLYYNRQEGLIGMMSNPYCTGDDKDIVFR